MTCRPGYFSILLFIISLSFCSCKQDDSRVILAVGDSHGAWEEGWVNQLKALRPNDSIINTAVSGNTIGFDNLGNTSLNELKNIRKHLTLANSYPYDISYIIVLLGTNDCKSVFDSLQSNVTENLDTLIGIIASFNFNHTTSKIILATPPPIATDEKLEPKYYGGRMRLEKLLPSYQSIAKKYDCIYLNTYNLLLKDFDSLNKDGIHLNEEGYRRIALLLNEQID